MTSVTFFIGARQSSGRGGADLKGLSTGRVQAHRDKLRSPVWYYLYSVYTYIHIKISLIDHDHGDDDARVRDDNKTALHCKRATCGRNAMSLTHISQRNAKEGRPSTLID